MDEAKKKELLQAMEDVCDEYCATARGSEAEKRAGEKHAAVCDAWIEFLKSSKEEEG